MSMGLNVDSLKKTIKMPIKNTKNYELLITQVDTELVKSQKQLQQLPSELGYCS